MCHILNLLCWSGAHLFLCKFLLHSLLTLPASLLSLPWTIHAVFHLRGLCKTPLIPLLSLWAEGSFPCPQRLAFIFIVIMEMLSFILSYIRKKGVMQLIIYQLGKCFGAFLQFSGTSYLFINWTLSVHSHGFILISQTLAWNVESC